MKRILSILTALMLFCMGWVVNANAQSAVTVGAQVMDESQLVSGKPYVLQIISGNNPYIEDVSSDTYSVPAAGNTANVACVYFLHDQGNGKYKIQNVYTGKYWHAAVPGYNVMPVTVESAGNWSLNLENGLAHPLQDGDANNGVSLYGDKLFCWNGTIISQNDIKIYEIDDLWIEKSSTEAASLTTGQWYVMYNRGRQGYVYENTVNKLYHSPDPSGPYSGNAKFLIRLEDAGSGKYYVQTGLGHYMGVIPRNSAVPTTNNSEEKMTIGKINGTDGHFYIQGVSNSEVLDCQQSSYPVVGWYTSIPTSLNGNNDWAFYPVEFTKRGATQTNPSDIVNGGVYSLYCVFNDGDYPVYNENGVPSISTATNTTPQLFVFRESATTLTGATLYNLQCIEGDGNYLSFTTSSGKENTFSTTKSNYLILNDKSSLPSDATKSGTLETSPFVGLYGHYTYGGTSRYPYFRGSNQPADLTKMTGNDTDINKKINGITGQRDRTGDTGYEYRWLLMKEPYTVYNLVVTDGTNPVNDVWVIYTNPNDVGIARSEQQHGGLFAISNDVTPTNSMFSCPAFPDATISISGTTVTVTLTMDPDNLEDRGVYTIYCAYDNGNYPIYNNSGTPKISAYSDGRYAPQLFAFFQDGTNNKSTPKYRLKCADGDDYGKNLYYTGATTYSFNATNDERWFVFVNNSSDTKNNYSWTSGNGEDSPYTSFFQFYGASADTYRTIVGMDKATLNGNSGRFDTDYHCDRAGDNSQYNSRWLLKKEPYSAYSLVVQDAGGTAINNVSILYSNPDDVDITRPSQLNGGFFVIKDGVTPSIQMFKSTDVRYKVTACSVAGSTITITLGDNASTKISEGRYVMKNKGRNKYWGQSEHVTSASDGVDGDAYYWDVVPSASDGQFYLRNVGDGRYLPWSQEINGSQITLVESPVDAMLFSFSTEDANNAGCVAIRIVPLIGQNSRCLNAFGWSGELGKWGAKDDGSDWYIYPVDILETGVEYLIQNKQSKKLATRGANDDAQLVQNALGAADVLNSIWTLSASGTGYKIANKGSVGNYLAKVTASGTFTTEGRTWYIERDVVEYDYYNIGEREDIDGPSHTEETAWNNYAGGGSTIGLWMANGNAGSCWKFVSVDDYYQNAVAYLSSFYDHRNDMFYISETAYNTLTTAAHSNTAEKIAAANAMYNVWNNVSNLNMPEDGKDYLIRSHRSGKNVNTVETGTKLNLEGFYNSSFFWNVEKAADGKYYIRQRCYGTTGGQYPSDPYRYIAYTQPANGDASNAWVYTSRKPDTPLNFKIYPGVGCTLIFSNHIMHNNNNTGYPFTYDYENDEGSKWEFITVKEASVSLIAAATEAIANATANPGAAFSLTEEVLDDIQDAIDALRAENGDTYQNYRELENLLNAHSSYYWLASGRYLVRNYEFDPDGDGDANDTETYLTSLMNPEGVVEDAIGYWSIWDITNHGENDPTKYGQYTMVNEGNKYILVPGRQLDGIVDLNHDERSDGRLFYDASKDAFQVEKPAWEDPITNDDETTLLFFPASSASVGIPTSEAVSGNFAAISVPSQAAQGKYMNMYTASDHVASYSLSPAERKGCFWQFIPINSQNETNHEGTHSGEAEMFANQVNGLAGYVGGVVTLDNVESVPCLNDIVLLRNAAVAALDGGTALNYTNSPYEAVSVNQNDYVGAKAYRAILDRIHDIKDGKVGAAGTPDASIKKYYQDLRPTEEVEDQETHVITYIYHPFFLENMSGQRPEFGGRLSQTSETGYWKCVRQVEANDNLSVFYVRRNGVVGDNATYWLRNGQKTGAGNFLKHGTLANNEEVGYVAHDATDTNGDGIPDEALEFRIDPVIPGVWQMYDVGAGSGPSRYLTITGTGPTVAGHNYTIQYYNKSETSTLWKFKTFNDLDSIYLRSASSTQYNNEFFCTFSYPMNIKLPKKDKLGLKDNPVPYYCSHAYYSKNGTSAALKIELTALPCEDDYYYLEGAHQGYMFMCPTANANIVAADSKDKDHVGKAYIDNAEFLTGKFEDLPDEKRIDSRDNLFKPNLTLTPITADNWRNIYALNYIASGTTIGSYHGNPVEAVGIGFYHIRLGGKLNPQTAYIHRGSFSPLENDNDLVISEVHESNFPVEIILKDEDGNVVDQIEALPDGTMQRIIDGPVYDLAGRRVTKPTRGIYIQNGRKVMYK